MRCKIIRIKIINGVLSDILNNERGSIFPSAAIFALVFTAFLANAIVIYQSDQQFTKERWSRFQMTRLKQMAAHDTLVLLNQKQIPSSMSGQFLYNSGNVYFFIEASVYPLYKVNLNFKLNSGEDHQMFLVYNHDMKRIERWVDVN